MTTWWTKLGGNLPLGHDALLFSISVRVSCSRTDTARQSWTTERKVKVLRGTRQIRTAHLSVHSRTRQPPDHCPRSKDQLYPGSSRGGGTRSPPPPSGPFGLWVCRGHLVWPQWHVPGNLAPIALPSRHLCPTFYLSTCQLGKPFHYHPIPYNILEISPCYKDNRTDMMPLR